MDRRESLKLMLLTAAGPGRILDPQTAAAAPVGFVSPWHDWPDLRWAGPGFWGNRLQDWEVHEGTLRCRTRGPGRTLHLLTHRATALPYGVGVQIAVPSQPGPDTRVGFRLGGRGRFDDYRSAAVHGLPGSSAAHTAGFDR